MSSPTNFQVNPISSLFENAWKPQKCDGWTDEQMDKAIAMSPSNFIGRGKQQKNQPKNKEK